MYNQLTTVPITPLNDRLYNIVIELFMFCVKVEHIVYVHVVYNVYICVVVVSTCVHLWCQLSTVSLVVNTGKNVTFSLKDEM